MDEQVVKWRDLGSRRLELQIVPELLEKCVKITIEKGDRAAEGNIYRCFGDFYFSKGAFRKAIEYHEKHL